jgi:hypothetical protein
MPEPKRGFMFDGEKLTEVIDYRGSQGLPPRPEQLNCDFCHRLVKHLWCYQCAPFTIDIVPGRAFAFSGGPWNACCSCRPFIEPRDRSGLLAHVLTVNPAVDSGLVFVLSRAYEKVFAAMKAEPPVEWLSGDLFPVEGASET